MKLIKEGVETKNKKNYTIKTKIKRTKIRRKIKIKRKTKITMTIKTTIITILQTLHNVKSFMMEMKTSLAVITVLIALTILIILIVLIALMIRFFRPKRTARLIRKTCSGPTGKNWPSRKHLCHTMSRSTP